jgi:hypothetical protein
MEGKPNVTQPVVIRQDDASELRIHAVIQSGRRQLDIRIWRRGPTGFAPSRNALTLELSDVNALHDGISELLEASGGGQQVARVVLDTSESRRLRAETEPFGTRYLARLGFWQRVRDTWRPSDDGLVLTAECLPQVRGILADSRSRLQTLEPAALEESVVLAPASLQRWPAPGADWITIELDRRAFHPRGIRITATVEEEDGRHRLVFRPWRRHESLWLPHESSLALRVPELDSLLTHLRQFADGMAAPDHSIACMDGGTLRVLQQDADTGPSLLIERRGEDSHDDARLSIPLIHLPRFGRMLAQSGMLLITHLGEEERQELQRREGPEIAPEIVAEALPPPEPEPEPEDAETRRTEQAAEADANDAGTEGRAEPEPVRDEPPKRFTPMGEIQLGRQCIFLYLLEEHDRHLSLQWNGRSLLIPVDHVEEMLEDLRTLYYDALRGRRGHVSTVGGEPSVHMSVHNQGSTIAVVLEHELDGRQTRLAFPVAQVPTFLNTASAVMRRLEQ